MILLTLAINLIKLSFLKNPLNFLTSKISLPPPFFTYNLYHLFYLFHLFFLLYRLRFLSFHHLLLIYRNPLWFFPNFLHKKSSLLAKYWFISFCELLILLNFLSISSYCFTASDKFCWFLSNLCYNIRCTYGSGWVSGVLCGLQNRCEKCTSRVGSIPTRSRH